MDTEPRPDTRQHFGRRIQWRAVLPYAVGAVLLIGSILIFGREIEHHLSDIETWIEGLGPWAPVIYIGLFVVLSSMFLPDTLLAIVAGALFGLVRGTGVVLVGALIAAALQHFLSRRVLRKRIDRALAARPSLLAIQQAVLRQEFRLQVLLRLTPVNPALMSYVLGSAGVRFRGFMIACLALTPHLFLEVYFGHASKHLVSATSDDRRTTLMHDAIVGGGLLVGIVVMFFVSRTARKAVQEAVA